MERPAKRLGTHHLGGGGPINIVILVSATSRELNGENGIIAVIVEILNGDRSVFDLLGLGHGNDPFVGVRCLRVYYTTPIQFVKGMMRKRRKNYSFL